MSAHGMMDYRIDPSLSYFLYQPVLHDWVNKGQMEMSLIFHLLPNMT